MSAERRKPDDPAPVKGSTSSTTPEFRWQAFFQRSTQALYLLDRQRRILFVNRAWEALTGMSAAEARGRSCTRRKSVEPGENMTLLRVLAPPADAQAGRLARVRRLAPRARNTYWDLEFLPLWEDDRLLGTLGVIRPRDAKLHPVGQAALPDTLVALHDQARKLKEKQKDEEELWQPDTLLSLRQRVVQRHGIDLLSDDSPFSRQIADQANLVSQSLTTVLIIGEPGTGKHWLARAIHNRGITAEQTFAALDCAHLPADALAAILFGDGLPQPVNIGTVYLENLGCLRRDLQERLLDAVISGKPERRWITATSKDLIDEVRAGRLSHELSCALSTVVIRLLPIRERHSELTGLVERFLERAASVHPHEIKSLAHEAWDRLRTYSWPGNLDELYTVLAAAAGRAKGEQIEVADLPFSLRIVDEFEASARSDTSDPLPLDHLLEEAERRLILLALARTHGHRARAADLLAIQRPRLFRRMKALGLMENEKLQDGEDEVPIESED